jgi:hypothetical protein
MRVTTNNIGSAYKATRRTQIPACPGKVIPKSYIEFLVSRHR